MPIFAEIMENECINIRGMFLSKVIIFTNTVQEVENGGQQTVS